ncbi:MAG: hypothetical protein UY94_C0010G0004 [Parcubacteria group bacterium GW2011_GWA2_56_21]|nr:MAG: hypothetical protein UY94_C0010G0004 [Parcubacteria group bacterium GW2011_GWA2_56_21]
MYPHTVLNPDESCTFQQSAKLRTYTSSTFADIKNEYAPLPIPKCRFGYYIFSKLNLFKCLNSLFCYLNFAIRVFARHSDQSVLLQSIDSLRNTPIKLCTILGGTIQFF